VLYEDVFKTLNKNKIKYLVIGGLAVNLHGFIRMTLDLDLIISLDNDNKIKFYKLMKSLKFKTRKPKLTKKIMLESYKPKNTKVITFFRDEFELIDVFIENPIDFSESYKNRKTFKYNRINIPTIPLNLLIKMKRKTGRERDLIDIGYLKQIKKRKKQ